jgi:hypothetical protein
MNFLLFRSIAEAYRVGTISRRRFVEEWAQAQRALGITAARRAL